MRKFLLSLAFGVLLAPLAFSAETRVANLFLLYPLDATAVTYCAITGQNNSAFGGPIAADFAIKTTGSSTSITENTASTNPFTPLAAGDILLIDKRDGTTDVRRIVTRTDAANVVVDTASTLTGGFNFRWLKSTCGTAATSGWIDVAGLDNVVISLQIDQLNVTGGIDAVWQCRSGAIGAAAVTVYPGETDGCGAGTLGTGVCNFTTVSSTAVVISEPWSACRVGVLIHTADDGVDTTTLEEQITVTVTGRIQSR